MFSIYILRCKDNSYYIGHTLRDWKNIRLVFGGYASCRLPIKLVYAEDFATRAELEAEGKLKKWSRK